MAVGERFIGTHAGEREDQEQIGLSGHGIALQDLRVPDQRSSCIINGCDMLILMRDLDNDPQRMAQLFGIDDCAAGRDDAVRPKSLDTP